MVRGVVQGVGYRFSAVQAARQRGVSGWVANCPDGTVEAVLEGDPAVVESMVDWCRHGPAGARVDELVVTEELPEGLDGFGERWLQA
jgi:acylphosphatase